MGTTSLGLRPKLIEARRHHLKLGGADIGAMGEAEEDQHIAPAEILIGDGLSGLIDEGEGTADQRLAAGLRPAGPARPALSTSRAAPPSAPMRKPATITVRRRPRIYSPNCTSVPFSRALPRNQLKVR